MLNLIIVIKNKNCPTRGFNPIHVGWAWIGLDPFNGLDFFRLKKSLNPTQPNAHPYYLECNHGSKNVKSTKIQKILNVRMWENIGVMDKTLVLVRFLDPLSQYV